MLLNRVLLEPSECETNGDGRLVAELPSGDPRTIHIRGHVQAECGDMVRAGIVDAGATNAAKVTWLADDAMRLELGEAAHLLCPMPDSRRPRLDVLLAMPRPAAFARLLPMLSSMGIGTLWLTQAERVENNYFSSHLLKVGNEHLVREALLAGLEQSGDTALPRFKLRRNLKKLLTSGDLEASDTGGTGAGSAPLVKLACHPERLESTLSDISAYGDSELCVRRIGDVELPPNARLLLAVGPERGWEEPEELDLLVSQGFQLVTLGPRTLRTDVATIAMLAVAHEALTAADARM